MKNRRLRFCSGWACFALPILATIPSARAQVTVSGHVRTLAGDPIAGATVRLVTLGQNRLTNAEGFYDFGSGTSSIGSEPARGFSARAQGRTLRLELDAEEKVSVEIFDLAGKHLHTLAEGPLGRGSHSLPLEAPDLSRQLRLLKVQVGGQASWHRLAFGEGFATLTRHKEGSTALLAKMAFSAPDSIHVSHPSYDGGLVGIHARKVSNTTGVQNFRLVSTSTDWDIAMPAQVTFGFTHAAGSARFQQLVPQWNRDQRKVMYEVVQSLWRTPQEIPANKRHTRFTVNFPDCGGVASASGTTINFCGPYVANQPNTRAGWIEVLGVLIHETMHTYQPYYAATGASGFGEAVPDAVRALTGYFPWRAAGSRCSGDIGAAYQAGGRYWLYMEYKHPGFLNRIYKITTGDISARVQQATGVSMSTLVSECQSQGMPPGSG